MYRMTPTVIVMMLLVLFMLAGAIPTSGENQAAVFHSPVFFGVMAVLSAFLVFCSWKGGWSLRRAGFLLAHLGVVAVLGGALAGWMVGESHEFILPVHPGHFVRQTRLQTGQAFSLPFGMSCDRFRVDYYDPSYALFEPVKKDGKTDYRKVSTQAISTRGDLNLGPLGRVSRADLLHAESQDWADEYTLSNGWTLQRLPPTPKRYSAELAFQVGGGEVRKGALSVNHPVVVGAWRFYLMSYDRRMPPSLFLLGRRDPGRSAVVAGIWMVILGTLLLGAQGWKREGVAHERE